MVKETYQNLIKGIEVRQTLSQLRQEIKKKEEKEQLRECIGDHFEVLISLLKSEDAKTRKNLVLLMGDLGDEAYLDPLYDAYEEESQMFVKSAYLTALKEFDYREYLLDLKARMQELSKMEITMENKKHVAEEIRALSDLIVCMEGVTLHKFIGNRVPSEVVLLANRRHTDKLMEQLKELPRVDSTKAHVFSAGIRLETNYLEEVLALRTYQEALFLVKGMKTCGMNPEQAAKVIVDSHLLEFLKERHQGKEPFYFRVELKSKMPLDKKSDFSKKIASEIERLSERKFINSTSNYEIEIRLIENKEGTCNVMVKLFTIPEERFTYRKEVTPTSIKPSNAALLVLLAKEYMVEDAQVLDPFCGVGTMLIERQMQVKANTSYGIDHMSDAILKARINMEAAGQIIHFVNKDYFEFTHEYLFDEIFTNMPFAIGRKSQDEIYDLYVRFFETLKQHLKKDGTIILYTHDREFVKKLAKEFAYQIIKEEEFNVKEDTHLMILR